MKIGAHLLLQDFPEFIKTTKALEDNNFARAWVVDSQMLWEDAYIYVALAMEQTKRIIFGSAVSNPVNQTLYRSHQRQPRRLRAYTLGAGYWVWAEAIAQ